MRHPSLRALVFALLAATAARCTQNVDPRVAPAKVATVQPPVDARVLLLVAPAFETYTTESQFNFQHYVVHLGSSASKALQDMLSGSFQHVEVLHVADAEVVRWLSAPADTARADVLIVPTFGSSSAGVRLADFAADVILRLDIRSYRTGATYSWSGTGHATRLINVGWGGMTGGALAQALSALTDTLSANRAKLEGPSR